MPNLLRKLLVFTTYLLGVVFSLPNQALAQTDSVSANPEFPRHSIFLELLGSAGLYSLNYDYRFTRHLSARVGFEYFAKPPSFDDVDRGPVSVIPLMVNYMIGGPTGHFEVGGGVAWSSNDEGSSFGRGVIATIGYRSQPPDGGFFFRSAFTPIIAHRILPWVGLSLGVSF